VFEKVLVIDIIDAAVSDGPRPLRKWVDDVILWIALEEVFGVLRLELI
jgi:hypothetical protein